MQYVDSRLAITTVNATTKVFETAPGYTTLQAMAKVPIREPGLRPAGEWLQPGYNEKYYDLLHPAHVAPGAARLVLFTLILKM